MKVWVVADRRIGEAQVMELILEGEIVSLYFIRSAAENARFETEAVWEINIKLTNCTNQTHS